MKDHPLVIGFYGESKGGKTSLIESLTKELTKKGYQVATVKHTRGEYSLDKKGKDTWRHGQAGAALSVFASPLETTFLIREEKKLKEIVRAMNHLGDWDVILVEGFKEASIPKIAVGQIESREGTILTYKDNYEEVRKQVIQKIEVQKILNRLPGLDCEKCGFTTCQEMALAIYSGDKNFTDCVNMGTQKVSLKVNGERIQLGQFPTNLIKKTVEGMVSSLKGVDEVKSIRVDIED